MSEEIKNIMDALENNELKDDGFWGRACSRLSQQLQKAKEKNEKLTQQNKQMREALIEIANHEKINGDRIFDYLHLKNIAQQALKGAEQMRLRQLWQNDTLV